MPPSRRSKRLNLFARERGVEVLLENIPNELSSAERLVHFLDQTHLKLNFCLDVGHANMNEGVAAAFAILKDRIRSTHLHDNNGDGRQPPLAVPLARRNHRLERDHDAAAVAAGRQYPLLLELRDYPEFPLPAVARHR